jgi:hypothetical protein
MLDRIDFMVENCVIVKLTAVENCYPFTRHNCCRISSSVVGRSVSYSTSTFHIYAKEFGVS